MDKNLLDQVIAETPQLNSRIMNGLATEQLMGVEQFVDQIFRCAAQDFPEGLVYEGYKRCSPKEEFNVATKARENQRRFDLARNDYFMVKYVFTFNGEELFPRYMYLPYVNKGGILHIRGKRFAISPVLADPAFSISGQSMFIQLTRIRLTFERTTHHFMLNEDRESTYVVWSWVHTTARNRFNKSSSSSRIKYSTMANYLFARFGFTETMKRFAGVDVVAGEDDINTKNYPKSKWVICSSTGIRPRAFDRKKEYRATNIRIAIPKDQYGQKARSLIGSFFYIADHFPNDVRLEDLDDVWMWKVVLGLIIYGPGSSYGIMVQEIDDHLMSMDEYVDFMVKQRLERVGIKCDDIYEMFMYVIEMLAHKTITNNDEVSSIYGKQLITLRYVLFDIISKVNTLMYKLKNVMKKHGQLSENEINAQMNRHLFTGTISKISNHALHPEVVPISTSNDNMFFGITCNMVPQDNASGSGSKKNLSLEDPSRHLHVSLAEVGSYSSFPKADPTGRSRINPCLKLAPDGMVLKDPDKQELLERVQRLISR
tara:strand:- start:68843 stop:70465 length:1623 start_codon:yes stop_codon:yes gene_type:complete